MTDRPRRFVAYIAILTPLLIGLIYAYAVRETITPDRIALYVSILTLLIMALGNLLQWREIRAEQEWNRRNAAQKFLFDVMLGRFWELRKTLENRISIYDESQTYATKSGIMSAEDKMTLNAILNYLEVLCLCIKNHVIDEDIAFDSLHGLLFAYLRWAGPYIKDKRNIDKRMWIEIDPVAEKWKKRRAGIEKPL